MNKDLFWIFFISKGITNFHWLISCKILCLDVCILGEKATVKNLKNMQGYRLCLTEIPQEFIFDEILQSMIDYNKTRLVKM